MTILYTSYNVNLHQVPFVKALMSLVGEENVKYAAIHTYEHTRAKMGMTVYEGEWIIDVQNNKSIFEKWWMDADVVLSNVRSFYDLFEKRLKTGKLTFYYSERWFKEPYGLWRLLHPNIVLLLYKYHQLSKYPNFFYLPQGKFAYGDLARFNIFKDKGYQFGYITPTDYEFIQDTTESLFPVDKINLLWAGKIHHVKRVDLLAKAYVSLFENNKNCHLTIIGEGDDKPMVEDILSLLPESSYTLLPYVKNEVLHEYMRQADVYVFPSNGAEGWGAVVNEAMYEDCAVVVSDKVGALLMIENGINGMVFSNENLNSLTECLIKLVNEKGLIDRLKIAAKKTIQEEWNANNAARKFLNLCHSLETGMSFNSNGLFKKL